MVRLQLITRFFKKHAWLSGVLVVFGLSFLVYSQTAARLHLNYADSDELVTAAYTGGIAHPPGYPLYTLLLQGFMRLPLSASIAFKTNLSSALFQSLSLVGLYSVASQLLTTRKGKFWALVSGTLFVGFTYSFWFHANVAEVFPFSHLLAIWFIWLFIKLTHQTNLSHHRVWLAATGAVFGLGASHHQIFLLLLPFWLWLIYRINSQRLRLMFASISLLGFVLPYSLLWIYYGHQAQFSWYFDPSFSGLIDMISRRIYTAAGSAVELDAYRWEPFRSLLAVWQYLLLLTKEYLFIGIGLAILGVRYLYKKHRAFGWLWLISWLVSGVGLAMFMKFPQTLNNSDQGYYWGWALRERMLLMSKFLFAIPVVVGVGELFDYFAKLKLHKIKQYLRIVTILLLVGLPIFINYRSVNFKHNNFTYYFSRNILQSLPENAVLIVDSDSVFGLLYEQLVNSFRTDLKIVPLTVQMRWPYFQHQGQELLGYSQYYGSREDQLAHLVSWNLSQHRQVYLFDPDTSGLEVLGLEANPFYARPYGYTIEVNLTPAGQIKDYDYGLTAQLANIAEHQKFDDWDLGWLGNLAKIHTTLAYYYGRLGSPEGAFAHIQIASQLVRLPHNQQEITKTLAYINSGQLSEYNQQAPLTAQQWFDQGSRAERNSDLQGAVWAYQRAVLKDPHLISARKKLIEIYIQTHQEAKATEEQQVLAKITTLIN